MEINVTFTSTRPKRLDQTRKADQMFLFFPLSRILKLVNNFDLMR